MKYSSTKVTETNKVITDVGGQFEGVQVFNGSDTAILYIADNTSDAILQVSSYNNDPTVTVEDSSQLTVGDLVTGTGIPLNATIASITNATVIELSVSTTGGDTTGPLEYHPLSNTIAKFHIAADTTHFFRGFGVVCRNGIKIVSSDWDNLEVFVLHN